MSVRPVIVVERPGALTTVQDLGRDGFESSGVPRGGAFDPWAARAANRLVGNDDHAALLELTLAGPTLRFTAASVVALVGDDFDLRLDGEPRAGDESLAVAAGVTLEIGRARSGARAWLAIGGGIDVPAVLGSRSTELATGFGGHEGRALRQGDVLWLFPSMEAFVVRRFVSPERIERSEESRSNLSLRVLPGPDERLLGPAGTSVLAEGSWRVSPRSDRRGVRVAGAALPDAGADAGASSLRASMRSIPMLPGAVELTPDGQPIVLGVDAPVTGGYPWVAQLIEADLGLLAHLAPGAEVRFEPASFAAAERALAERKESLDAGIVSP